VTLASLRTVHRPGALFLVGSFGFSALLLAFAPSTVYQLSLGILFANGFCLSMFGTLQSTILLNLTGDEMRGRVMGVLSFCIGIMPVGILASGALADAIGAPLTVGISAGVASAIVLVIFFVMPSLRRTEYS
jgi:MFS family permease